MTTQVQPYLFFGGRCEDALGPQVDFMMRYSHTFHDH